jgi:hypothetical protein
VKEIDAQHALEGPSDVDIAAGVRRDGIGHVVERVAEAPTPEVVAVGVVLDEKDVVERRSWSRR